MTKKTDENFFDYDMDITPIFAEGWFKEEKEPPKAPKHRVKLMESIEPKCSSVDLTTFAGE